MEKKKNGLSEEGSLNQFKPSAYQNAQIVTLDIKISCKGLTYLPSHFLCICLGDGDSGAGK